MKASARKARNIVKNRRRDAKRPAGTHTLAGHLIKAGVEREVATGIAGALRSKLKSLGVAPMHTGRTFIPPCGVTGKPCYRWTAGQVLVALNAYSPRGAKQKEAKAVALAGLGN